jgi:serine-type D-Ala-D-Ala carboxypeptidase/endopeptidase (penicillin-binding protein 4)
VSTVAGRQQGATIEGDLFFVGGGDATLSRVGYPESERYQDPVQPYTRLDDLADRVAAKGVRRVTGRLVADESRYDTRRFIGQWQPVVITDGEAGPLSALLVDDGKVAIEDPLPATEPALTAAEVFRSLLEARGITIEGGVALGTTPAGTPVLETITSPPLTDIVREMMTTSDDNTAELLLKELGVVAGAEGSTEAGLAVVRATLASWGIPLDGVELYDGSGLSNANRVRCETILSVLDRMGPIGPFIDGLPTAAVSGTLRDEFEETPFAGVLRAKTGSLDIAKALSGYVPGPEHWVSFSLILNGPPRSPAERYERIWTALATGLATIPERVAPEPFAPGG